MDEIAQLSFSLSNGLGKPSMMAQLTLDLPSGWSMDGEGFADKCSGICTANYKIATGDQRYIEISAYPNHTGAFLLKGRVEFTYDGEEESHFVRLDVQINVMPPQPTAAPAAPAVQQATPTAIVATPAPTVQQATPTAIAATPGPAGGGQNPGAGGNGGCSAPPPDAPGVVEPSLLLAGLLLPAGILVRLGISRRRNGRNSVG